MLDPKMHDALNDQINAEMFSAYLYLAMSAWCESTNLQGSAIWFMSQAQEEMIHAMKFYNFILSRGGEVELKPLEKPQKSWKSVMEAFEAALEHEKYITGRINNLVNLAIELKEHASNQMLQWYVAEQVEEEDNVTKVIQKLKLVETTPGGLYLVDKELGLRPVLYAIPVTAL
jgi:ferritin